MRFVVPPCIGAGARDTLDPSRCPVDMRTPTAPEAIRVAYHQREPDGGRYRIRTYDFHRVKVALYR
jgi:hypothetical protein